MKVVTRLATVSLQFPLVDFIAVDQVGIIWGFGDVPQVMGNTWDGQGKSMIGTVGEGFDNTDWYVHVFNRATDSVVEVRTLRPKGRTFSWDDVPDYHIARVFTNKIGNAKDRNIRFTYSFAQFSELLHTKTCSITGVALEHKANGADNSSQFSIDRLDPNVGYEPGNCIVMSGTANAAKANVDKFLMDKTLTDEQKLKMIYKVENVLRKRIKATEAAKAAAAKTECDRKEAFGAKFAILPPALR